AAPPVRGDRMLERAAEPPAASLGGGVRARAGDAGVARADVVVVAGAVAPFADAGVARATGQARGGLIAHAAVGERGRVDAGGAGRIAQPRLVATVHRLAVERIATDARVAVAGGASRAGVAVVARRAVGRAEATRVAGPDAHRSEDQRGVRRAVVLE